MEALTLLVDYSTGGITNQRGCTDYDETKPKELASVVLTTTGKNWGLIIITTV